MGLPSISLGNGNRNVRSRSKRKLIRGLNNIFKAHPQLPIKFRLKELKTATENFNLKNELRRRGFGRVYKGLLKNKKGLVEAAFEVQLYLENAVQVCYCIWNFTKWECCCKVQYHIQVNQVFGLL